MFLEMQKKSEKPSISEKHTDTQAQPTELSYL